MLSVLSLALHWLADPGRQAPAGQRLGEILLGLARGDGVRLAPILAANQTPPGPVPPGTSLALARLA